VRPGGRVVLVGIPDEDRTAFPASLARRKGVTIALVRRMNEVYPRAIELVHAGRVDVSSLVTAVYPLAAAPAAFASAVAREGLKVVVAPSQ
ncbi:MAG TPA: alcohol dehydrogenase, partial [Pilimelia sp.]|nr:alcohol dehydrogenase [Pilimelia sp.]